MQPKQMVLAAKKWLEQDLVQRVIFRCVDIWLALLSLVLVLTMVLVLAYLLGPWALMGVLIVGTTIFIAYIVEKEDL